MRLITTCILICLAGQDGFCAKILGLFPVPGKSHLSVTSSVMHGLAKKGHDVTIFVPFSTGFNASNYREIIYDITRLTPANFDMMDFVNANFLRAQLALFQIGIRSTEAAVKSPEAQALIRSEEKYDVIVMEQFVNEAFIVFVQKFKCPVVLISTFGTTSTLNRIFGNSAPWSYVPSEFLWFTDRMTLLERLQNALAIIYVDVLRKYYYMPEQQALAEKYFGDSGVEITDLEETERQANFVLINTHPAFSTPRPYMANMKNVAGMHIKPNKPLPLDLQRYIDSSKNGVILFSLGSAMQSILIPEHLTQALKGAFERLPFDILWKWENDTMTNKPKNVRIGKWLPQNDILAHPNVKLFITHGGISSTMETVHHGVPVVGIPLFGDQKLNINLARAKGFAEKLDFSTMTEDDIYNTISKVANDPKYIRNIQKVSAYWKDEMNHPLDQAIHWVEYVMKHDGANHLKAAVTEQNFVQYFLLDVIFIIIATLAMIIFAMHQALRLMCKRSKPNAKSKKTD
ncbi:UDP-glycosyltransferase UGT5-like isoform X2 [Athalia rosae]|nr:UDP-glycosyltransferase UGT5-like isoform X2 [Athalia rosae]XP_012258374.2 UDP-glycosyltransferase UGT5-like isoform X2 [Athalia rosae]